MAEGRPVLTQINIIANGLRRSLDFYRPVGSCLHGCSKIERVNFSMPAAKPKPVLI